MVLCSTANDPFVLRVIFPLHGLFGDVSNHFGLIEDMFTSHNFTLSNSIGPFANSVQESMA